MHAISFAAITSDQSADNEAFVQNEDVLNEPLKDGPGEMPFLNAGEEAIFRRLTIFRLGNFIATDCLQKMITAHRSDSVEASMLPEV